MRPRRSTWVASTTTSPAPELASMPRWVTCQSVATPSAALYWHIGATTMRLGSSRSARRMGENRALVMAAHVGLGSAEGAKASGAAWQCAQATLAPAQRCLSANRRVKSSRLPLDRNDAFDFDRNLIWQHHVPHGGAGVPARLAKHLDKEIGAAV